MKFHVFSLMEWPPDRSQRQLHTSELDQLTTADAQGYHGAWIAEHHSSRYGIGPSIHLTAAWLSARTSRIRIGTAVTVLPFFHPLRLAEEIAMLDIMSGGRFDWGIGRGHPGHAPESVGDEIEDSHRVFREQLDIVERAWTGERFSYDGEFFQIPELQCLPTPVQQPRPPIWIAAQSHDTLAWAARNDHPVLTDSFSPTPRIEERLHVYREAGAAAGNDVTRFDLPLLRHVYVGETMARAREEAGPALLASYRDLAFDASLDARAPLDSAAGAGPDAGPDALLDYLFDNCAIVGDAASCRDQVTELRERIGLDSLICWQNFGGLPNEASVASQQRLIERVAPAFA